MHRKDQSTPAIYLKKKQEQDKLTYSMSISSEAGGDLE